MAKMNFSSKRLQIDKANATMVIVVAASSFILVSSLVASQALLSQRSYQARVIAEKNKARIQLEKNVKAVDSLAEAYQKFEEPTVNLIGGSSTGTSQRDGDNARLVLDALPGKYDFPALTTSLEKILLDNHFKIEAISGTDQELSQQADQTGDGAAVEMPFSITVDGTYASIQNLMGIFEQSIRPFSATTLEFTGKDSDLKIIYNGKTYYLPEKTLTTRTKEVK